MPPRQLAEDDLGSNADYSVALFEQATHGETWVSPTKAVKRYHRPLKKRKREHGDGARSKADDLPNVDDQLNEVATPDVDLMSWESVSMDHGVAPLDLTGPTEGVGSDPTGPHDSLAAFIEAVETFGSGWYCITDSLFVVQGWDARRAEPTVRSNSDSSPRGCLSDTDRAIGITFNT